MSDIPAPTRRASKASPRAADEYARKWGGKRKEGVREGFTVYVPAMTGELAFRLSNRGGRWNEVDFRDVRFEFTKIARGGRGHVWIGRCMVEPQEFYNALTEVEGYESDVRSDGEVGFEWWVEGGDAATSFKLIPTVRGWCILETAGSYGAIRDIYRVKDLLKGFALLGYLEDEAESAKVLAPLADRLPMKPQEIAVATPDELEAGWVFPAASFRKVVIGLVVGGIGLGIAIAELLLG